MAFPTTVYCHRISFEIPDNEFRNVLDYETADGREFDLPSLSTMLDLIPGVDGTDYSGHYGAQVFAEFEVDENGQTPQVAEFQALLEDFLIDARRIRAVMPEIMDFPRHNVPVAELDMEPEPGWRVALRKFLYGDDDFLIATSEDRDQVSIFHRAGGELERLDATIPQSVLRVIHADRMERSFHPMSRKPITMSKDMTRVRRWVSSLIPLDVKLPSVDVADHPLADDLPRDTRPVLRNPKFVVSDGGPDLGLAVSFVSEGEVGTKWFTDEARRSILRQIEDAGGNLGRLSGWLLTQLPPDVERPGLYRAPR